MADGETEGLVQKVQDLARQVDVDRELIDTLLEQGVVDRNQIDSLETALITCRRIGAAMGVLMATDKITESDAFDRLRDASQGSHRKLREVADDVLLTGVLPDVSESSTRKRRK